MADNQGHALAREELVRTLTAYTGTTTSDGATDYSSLIDSKLINVNDYLTGKSILILSGDALYETIGISSFSPTTGEITFGGALSCQIVAGVNFRVLNTLPESIHITSGLITMEGYDYVSGEYRRVAVNASGVLKVDVEVAISSGLNVTAALISGGFVTAGLTSGGFVTADMATPTSVLTRDILLVTDDSGGMALVSGLVKSMTLKSLSGDVFVGGTAAGDMPYSGHGFLLAAGEAWSLDIDNFSRVKVCANVSGDWVSYGGVK